MIQIERGEPLKNGKTKASRNRPQQYVQRVEIALLALKHVTLAAQTLVHFVLEQLGPDWSDMTPLDSAEKDLRRARTWLRKQKRHTREKQK